MSPAAKSKIDPLNQENYGAISVMLAVVELAKASSFTRRP